MRNNIYFTWFMDSLTEEQKSDYEQRSLNQQKDWYISYLEKHFDGNIKRLERFLDKKNKEFNPNLDNWNASARGYNNAIQDTQKELTKL